ncbi:MAG: 6-carboxytetrahydropterin synthase QueD [Candidatus Omnitrophota bacterium]
MFELVIRGEFAASHRIKGHNGKCKNLHGHTWKVEAVLLASRLNSIGLTVDFKILKKTLDTFLDQLDHSYLNDLPFFKTKNPSTENIAKFIFEGLAKQFRPLRLKQVTVWESDRAGLTYYSRRI